QNYRIPTIIEYQPAAGSRFQEIPTAGGVCEAQKNMSDSVERVTIRRVRLRLLPLLFLIYIASHLDRSNVGIAALQMNSDLGFGPAVFGFGAGIFYLGYAAFEVPSNLLLVQVGARRWIARIAITWGLVSCAMMWVRTPTQFY